MNDLLTAELETDPLTAAITAMPEALRLRMLAACKDTADRVVREMRSRLARQLGPAATGHSVAGIEAIPAFDGNGYVILSDRDPFPNLPLWLEKGTKAGHRSNYARTAPRPFFYASLALEAGGHERRVMDAMTETADAMGLGE